MSNNFELNTPLLEEPDNRSDRLFSKESFPKLLEHEPGHLDKASEYDYCMVFEVDEDTKGLTKYAYRILKKMKSHGLDTFLFFSLRRTHIFVMIRLSLERLRSFADCLEFKLLLDKDRLENEAKAGNKEKNIAPIDILHDPEESFLTPYEMIYAKYRDELPEDLYWRPENLSHPFRLTSKNPDY